MLTIIAQHSTSTFLFPLRSLDICRFVIQYLEFTMKPSKQLLSKLFRSPHSLNQLTTHAANRPGQSPLTPFTPL